MSVEIIPQELIPNWVIKGNYPINKDAFFTNKEIAISCYDILLSSIKDINLNIKDHIFIEPSAGAGSFYDLLPDNKIGMDIEPRQSGILKQSFFNFEPKKDKNYIAIGNPPFGFRAWLALAFLNKCAEFCDMVGFILPMYFASNGKGSAKNRVKNMDLLHTQELPPNIFYKADDSAVNINTVFQVWVGKGIVKSSTIESIPIDKIKEYVDVFTVCTSPARRCGLDKLHLYDCFIQSTYYKPPKIVYSFDEVKYGSGYGIIIKKHKTKVKHLLEQTDWDMHCLRATNHCKHLGMHSIYSGLYNGGLLNC